MFTKSKFSSEQIYSRQKLLPGYDQEKIHSSTIGIVGVGGLGGWVSVQLARKGVGQLVLIDQDKVSVSNLARQPYSTKDVGKFKTDCLRKNLRAHAVNGIQSHSIPMMIQSARKYLNKLSRMDAILCGVDNNAARRAVCEYGIKEKIPVVFYAMDLVAESFAVWIQKPGGACLYCMNPSIRENLKTPCAVPSCIDTCFMASGLAVYALDSVLMNTRQLNWNYCRIHINGFGPDVKQFIQKQRRCEFCDAGFNNRANSECVSVVKR